MSSKIENLIKHFISIQNASGANASGGTSYITLGVVVDTDDPLQMGRLKIFCPTLNDDPKQTQYIPWTVGSSPFSGMVDNPSFTRGNGDGPETSEGSVHYGFWAIPEVGSHMLVTCIDGDFKRRVWLGCVPHHQEARSIINGIWKLEGGTLEGPYTATGSPIEPLYTNLAEAFNDEKDSAEWKSRAGEYQYSAVRDDVEQVPNAILNETDQTVNSFIENEPESFVHKTLGSHGYDWTGNKNLGAFLSSRAYGWSTPGMHSISMDDRHFNCRMKFRTSTGHQIILDDVNERIYISTHKGKNWIEMDGGGNVDIFSEMRVSIHAENDINLTSKKTIRMNGEEGIYMFAGKAEDQDALPGNPTPGQIRMHAIDDIHVITEQNYRHLSVKDSLYEIGGKKCETIGDSLFLQVENDINAITNSGNFNVTVSGNYNELVRGNVRKYALGSMRNMSDGDAHMYSFKGKMDVGAQKTVDIKSVSEDVVLESIGKNEDSSGGVYMRSPKSMYYVSSEGINSISELPIQSKSKESFQHETDPTLVVEPSPQLSIPMGTMRSKNASLSEDVPIDGFTGADLAARVAWNAGFRGDDLVVAVAIAGAETQWNPDYSETGDGNPDKWGETVGMWKIRTLLNSEEWSGLEANRSPSIIGGLENVQENANFAYSVWSVSGFNEWDSYLESTYIEYVAEAQTAIENMNVDDVFALSSSEIMFDRMFGLDLDIPFMDGCGISMTSKNNCSPSFKTSTSTSLSIGVDGINLQSQLDTVFKSMASNIQTKLAEGIVSTIDQHRDRLNELQSKFLSSMDIISNLTGVGALMDMISDLKALLVDLPQEAMALIQAGIPFPFNIKLNIADFVPDFPWDQLLGDICNFRMPTLELRAWANFSLGGFDLCEILDDGPSGSSEFNMNEITQYKKSLITIR